MNTIVKMNQRPNALLSVAEVDKLDRQTSYAARDPEIVAGVGLDLIMAEKPSIIGIQSAVLALLRPFEEEEVPDPEARYGLRFEQKPPRRFMPSWPELIDELHKQEAHWREMSRYALGEPEGDDIPF
jgi:hypothetical protein